MIRYIEREKLDIKKYNACIEQSRNHKMYGYSWYLDIVADNWGILIYGDYQYVMPLPWRNKYGIHYVYPPEWTQQLGVFSANKIDATLVEKFLKNIPRKFKKVTINFNSGNFNSMFETKSNFLLPLKKPHSDIVVGYSKLRKRHVKKTIESSIELNNSDNCNDLIEMFIDQKKDTINIIPSSYEKLKNLVSYLIENREVLIVKATNRSNELLGGAIFIIENSTIYYLFSTVNKEGNEKFIMTQVIDSIIKQYSETDYILDFEGSMVPGIARFFKSFGAKEEEYFSFKKYVVF
jgi:hypothetical protein